MRKYTVPIAVLTLVLVAGVAWAQHTPKPMVATYQSLADAILALQSAEADLITSVLQLHHGQAMAAYEDGDYASAAAEMTLFANEGDNTMAGIRNRLVEGGHHHHHHHAGDSDEMYDPGFLAVTREAKAEIARAAAAMRDAGSAMAADAAWERFDAVAQPLISPEE